MAIISNLTYMNLHVRKSTVAILSPGLKSGLGFTRSGRVVNLSVEHDGQKLAVEHIKIIGDIWLQRSCIECEMLLEKIICYTKMTILFLSIDMLLSRYRHLPWKPQGHDWKP